MAVTSGIVGVSGFQWDRHNRAKCMNHGVSIAEIEELFRLPVMVLPDEAHSQQEERLKAIGKDGGGPARLSGFHHP